MTVEPGYFSANTKYYDWGCKIEACYILLDKKNNIELASLLSWDNNQVGRSPASYLNDMSKGTRHSFGRENTKEMQIARQLAELIEFPSGSVKSHFAVGTIEQVLSLLTAFQREKIDSSVKRNVHLYPNLARLFSNNIQPITNQWYPIFRHVEHTPTSQINSILEGISSGNFDQKFHYMHAKTAHDYYEATNVKGYLGSFDCISCLVQFAQCESWTSLLDDDSFNGVVVLAGGGSPDKDAIIIDSIRHHRKQAQKPLVYGLIDASSHMLTSSISVLHKQYIQDTKKQIEKYVDFKFFEHDIYHLDEKMPLRNNSGKTLFMINGGTFGNLNETSFFISLSKVAKPKDLLVLGVFVKPENYDYGGQDVFNESLLNTYSPAYRIFLKSQINYVSELASKDIDINQMEVKITNDNSLHCVEDTVAVSAVTCDDSAGENKIANEIIWMKSARYKDSSLKNYCEQLGWIPLKEYSSTTKKLKYYLLEYSKI